MNSEISIENRKAMSIPQKGAVFNSAILLESQCNKESNDVVSYQFLFKRTAKRPDLLTVLNNFSKGTRINLEDGDYLIKSHDYTIKSLKKGIKVTGSFSTIPVSLSNPHVKQMTALEDFDHEYSKMEMTQPETYFRVYPYQNFNGPAFRAKLFSYVSTMGENYGYCDDKSLYYRRASLVMPKIKITKAIPQAKMMFHTHPKKDEPSISSPDDYLLYFDLSHKPRNIRHFYTVMADRMDYFHITPKHDKKKDYVKIDEDKFIEKLDKKMDEIAKKLDEKLPSKTAADDLYYCEKITKEVVKWLNKEYSKYFSVKYKCHYRVKKNPDKDMGEDLHLGDAFLAKALNDIKSGSYTWPEFDENSLPHEKYAFWYSLYYAMNMDRNGAGYSRVLRLQPGDVRRLHYFGNKRFEGTQFDYYDIINILLLNYDISMADAKVRDGIGTTSRIEEILDFLEVEEEIPRDNLILLTQVLEQGIHSDEARTAAGDHYFILPLIEACVLGLQSIEDVKAGANYELKKHELMVHSEKAGNATAQALGDLYNKTFAGTSKSLRPNPSFKRQPLQYNGKLPKHSVANVGLIEEIMKEFAPSKLDLPQNYETGKGGLSLRVKVEEEIVSIVFMLSTGNLQITANSDEAAIGAVRKVIEVMKPYIDFRPEDDIDNIGVITNEPVRNPKNAIIISVASPIQKTKNEVLTSLEKRLRDSTIATTYTTRTLREYEKRPHIVEVSDDMYNRLVSNGDIIMGISYGDSERRGYKRSDFEKSKYVLVDTMIRDQDLLSRANSSIISFYLHPTNSKGNVEYYLKNHVSPQEAKKVASLLDYLKDMASGDTFDHVIEYDINQPSFVIEEVFKEVPKSNPKGPDPLEQTIFGDGSSYLTAQTIPITALQNLRTGTSAATTAGPPLLNPKQPSVITISGPSGVGKTTIIKRISKMTGAEFVPSVTTRPLRPKEKEGVDKFVVTKERFEQMIANGEFVEHRKLKNGHYYGRRYSDFKDLSIVDVTLKGKNEFKKKFPNTFSIFLKPNVSADVLASHMRKRGGMSESERKGRADIIERMLESASKMDFDLVITSRVGEYEKVAEEIVPQLPQPNPKKYKGKASVVISRSTKKDKKLMAVFNFPDGRKKTTHFGGKGYSDYTIHKDKDRKKRYDTRHARREDWEDFTTAGALSKWILWNKPSLIDSFNHYKAMFSLDGAITVQTSQAGKIPASRNPPEEVFIENYLNPDRRERIIRVLNRRLKNIFGSKIKSRKDKLKQWREAYNWKGRNAESLLGAILSTIDKEIGNKSVFKIYRAMITLQFSEADFLNNMQTVPVGSSWSTYKEGADIYVGGSKFDYLGMRPGKQALLTATAHISAVDVYNTVLNRADFPQEKELTMYDDVKINRVDFYPIDDKARDKFLSWETTGKNWKPWIDPSIKPETVYKYQGQYVETYKSDVLKPTYITNPRADRTDTYLFDSNPRIPKKYEGQDPSEHSDLYTDEDPIGTIQGLGFKDAETARKSIRLIEKSGKTHAHKIQAAMAMEQRARFHPHATDGIKEAQKIYAAFIEEMKEKTKAMRNPSHCPIEVEARRAANDPSFKHHKWYVEHHLDYVMALMRRMPKVMGNWDREMVDMVWMHDYPKMIGGGHDLAIVNTLLTNHRGEDYAHKVVHQLHLMERLKKSDWNPLTEYSMVAANLSTADALSHYYGPFFQIYIDENPDMSMEEIKKSNRQKLAKDKLKLRAGPMKDGLDSIRFQYKGRKVRIVGNEHIKALIEKKNPSKTPEGRKIPKRYLKGLNKEEMVIAAKEIDKGYKYDIDDPKAYEFWKSDIKATARGYKTVPSKYKKKFIEMYGPLPEEGEFLDKMAKATKIKKSILEKVYDKGLAAWRGGHRPGVQQHQWAAGRVYSFVTLGNTVMKGKKKMPDHSLAVEAGLIKENPPSFIAARDPDKWAKRYDRVVKMSGEELMQKAIERASEKGLTIEMTLTEVDIEKKQEARKNFPLPPKYDKLYEKFLASNSYSTILLKRGEKVVDTLEFRLIEESPAELYEYLKSRERWSTKKGVLPLVARIHRRGGKSSLRFNSYFITAALQRKERFPIAVGGVGGYKMTDRQQGKGYYGIIKMYQAGFLEKNGIEAFGGGESPMRSDLYQSYGWLTAYSYKDNYPYSSTAAEYYLNLNRKDKLPNKDAGYFDLYRPVYSEAKKNPGWRHGKQMEDDPFAEYFEENVEGDENTTTV